MNIKFKNINTSEESNWFRVEVNPYRVGDTINLCGVTTEKHDGKLELKIDESWNGKYRVTKVDHEIELNKIISQNYTYYNCTIFIERID